MTTDATLTTKGQTTIPKEIRDSLGLKPGDRMTFTLMTDGTVVMRVKKQERHGLGGPPAQEGPEAGGHHAPFTLMLGLDTNVLVRFLVRDHEVQFERARRLIKREVGAQEKVLISLTGPAGDRMGAAQPIRTPKNSDHRRYFRTARCHKARARR